MRRNSRIRKQLEEKLFDLRTRRQDLSQRDTDLLVYGVRRYRRDEERRELLKRIQAVRITLRELRH